MNVNTVIMKGHCMAKKSLEFRLVPGYEKIAITNNGIAFNALTLEPIKVYKAGDRYLLSNILYPRKILNLHRLVALTWVKNDDPIKNIVINHIDGNPLNNYYKNLEWTTYSGNNYHAVNTGLRSDPIPCRIRDFITSMVLSFPSVAQACEYMGMSKDTHYETLRPKQFGKLIRDRYEFRYDGDNEPWFYEKRKQRITPARYKVVATHPCGWKQEIFSNRSFLKEFQLYKSPYGKSIPQLAIYAKEIYQNHTFEVYDYYTKNMVKVKNRTKSYTKQIVCTKGNDLIKFESLSKCAKHFKVSRSPLADRLKTGDDFQGWKIAVSV